MIKTAASALNFDNCIRWNTR